MKPILMHQMRSSTTSASSAMPRPTHLEIRNVVTEKISFFKIAVKWNLIRRKIELHIELHIRMQEIILRFEMNFKTFNVVIWKSAML
jgi:hypothetical protein